MFLLLLIAPKQKNFCVTKDRVPLRGSAVRLAPALLLSKPPGLRCPAFASGVAAPSQKTDRCPCSASAVSAAGSASAAQPAAHRCTPCALRARPPWGLQVYLTTKFASIYGRALGSPRGRAGAKRLREEQKQRLKGANKNRPRPYFADEGAVLSCAGFWAGAQKFRPFQPQSLTGW